MESQQILACQLQYLSTPINITNGGNRTILEEFRVQGRGKHERETQSNSTLIALGVNCAGQLF